MKLFNWFKRTPPRGIHSDEAAARWASTRFAPHLQPVAAYVADVLREQLGIQLSDIEPSPTFTVDLRMDDLEPVEFIMALEKDLAFSISDEDCGRLGTVAILVSYLYERLSTNERKA